MALNFNNSDNSGHPYYYSTGMINASDYNSIVDWYARTLPNFRFSHVNPGDIIRAQQINDLLNYIRSYQPSFQYTTLSGNVSVGSIVQPLYFGLPIKVQRSMTWTSNGTFTVPGGCYSIFLNVLLAGGGGGGTATNTQNGGTGGSGGSGGYIQNQTLNVTPGEVLRIDIGSDGLGSHYYQNSGFYDNGWGLNGGNSDFVTNSTTLTVYGGGGGGAAGPYSGGAAGTAGSPNGNPGTAGREGGSHHSHTSSNNGPAGANSPWGTGGSGGVSQGDSSSLNYGGNATGYGAGGGGAAVWDGSGGVIMWGGGNGSGGFCQITYPA